MSLGKNAWAEARSTLIRLLSASESALQDNEQLRKSAVFSMVNFCPNSCMYWQPDLCPR